MEIPEGYHADGRPRMGAWIEIDGPAVCPRVVPSRPRMGAWIEIGPVPADRTSVPVAPAWGRGLKYHKGGGYKMPTTSPPRGGVD